MSTSAAPAPAPTDQQAPTLESVLQSMNPAERTLISAAFGDMTKQLDETTRKNDTLKAQYSRIEQAAKVDKKLLTAQIETFINQLDDATRTQFNLSVEGCKADIVEENDAGAIRRNVDRMLMCCNAVMMQHTVANASGAKRRRVDADATPPAAAATPGAHLAGDAGRTGAPEQLFDPATAATPGDQLRAALRLFD